MVNLYRETKVTNQFQQSKLNYTNKYSNNPLDNIHNISKQEQTNFNISGNSNNILLNNNIKNVSNLITLTQNKLITYGRKDDEIDKNNYLTKNNSNDRNKDLSLPKVFPYIN